MATAYYLHCVRIALNKLMLVSIISRPKIKAAGFGNRHNMHPLQARAGFEPRTSEIIMYAEWKASTPVPPYLCQTKILKLIMHVGEPCSAILTHLATAKEGSPNLPKKMKQSCWIPIHFKTGTDDAVYLVAISFTPCTVSFCQDRKLQCNPQCPS